MSQKFQELINSEKPVLIDFFATWCGPCKVQSSVLNTVKENVGDLARIVKIDVDQFPAIAAEYGVRGVPTLAVFQNGNLLWKESGVHDVNTLTNLLQNFANQFN
ncbi:thioredoxin [Kaistella haifensis]|nr:thioredoxin [Kaistella haifensis]